MKIFCFASIACIVLAGQAFGQGFSLDTSSLDTSVRAQDDLFRYVNGTWLKVTEIPADKSNYGSFIALDDLSQERMKATIEKAAALTAEHGSEAQKIGDLYKSFMDEKAINEKGVMPISGLLSEYSELTNHKQVVESFAKLGVFGVGSPIGSFVGVDEKNSTQYLTSIVQGGTMLPDREYYLNRLDPKYDEHRAALVEYVNELVRLAGIEGEDVGQKVLDLETRLAAIKWSRVEMRDSEKTYNKRTVAELAKAVPAVDWPTYFELSRLSGVSEVNVVTPSYFDRLSLLIGEIPVDTWRMYLQVQIVDSAAPYLSDEFVNAHFKFHGTQLAGTQELMPRWKRAVMAITGGGAGDFGALGEAVGRLYVEEYFPAESKARMEVLVDNLLKSFSSSIDELSWMTDETKKAAREKLGKDHDQNRLYRKMAGLLGARGQTGRPVRKHNSQCPGRTRPKREKAGSAGGPPGVGHDATDCQRLLQS